MRTDKEKAIEFRKQGKPYNEISRLLGIPKSTLSEWFSREPWSQEVWKKNDNTVPEKYTPHLKVMHAARSAQLGKIYTEVREQATATFQAYKSDPLFAAGLMLYLGEGAKYDRNQVSIANSDPVVLKVFLNFLKKYSTLSEHKIKFWLLSYPDLDQEICLDYWLGHLKLERSALHKTQVIQGKSMARRLLYGVGNIRICDTSLRVKIDLWIKLLGEDLGQIHAGMV